MHDVNIRLWHESLANFDCGSLLYDHWGATEYLFVRIKAHVKAGESV